MRLFFNVLMFVGLLNIGYAQYKETLVDGWFVVENNRMKPVISLDDYTLVNLVLETKNKNDTFKICHSSPIDIWLNNALFFRQLTAECDKYWVGELFELTGSDSIVVSVAYEQYAEIEASIITSVTQEDSIIRGRGPDSMSNFYLESLMIILFAAAILKYFFPLKFERIFSNPLASRSSSDLSEFYTGFWDLENLMTTVVFSFLAAVQIIYMHEAFSIWPYLNTLNDQYLIQWLFVSGVILLFLLIKYLFSLIMSLLMQTRILPNIQFQDFIQVFMWVSILSLGLFFVDLYLIKKTTDSLVNLTYFLSITVLIGFQLWLYFKFVKFYSHKKLLIISYLCTTEFFPVFLIIFWLVK